MDIINGSLLIFNHQRCNKTQIPAFAEIFESTRCDQFHNHRAKIHWTTSGLF